MFVVLLTNFVDVKFWQNLYAECRQKAGKIGDLHFVRTNFLEIFNAIYSGFVEIKFEKK